MSFNDPKPIPELQAKDVARFWSKVEVSENESACWPWTAGTFARGYGAFRLKSGFNEYRQIHASRVAFKLGTGIDPAGLFVCHHCDNPPCCNPEHLFLGTAADNEQDKKRKGRYAPSKGANHCRAKLTEEGVKEIRRLAAAGTSQAALALVFGVDPGNISHIVRRQSWKHC